MPAATDLKGRTAVITGAASGIGRAIAISLARRGANLALADLDTARLAETEQLLPRGPHGPVKVSRHRLDVGDRDAVIAFPAEVLDEHAGVDVLVNNAGVALGGSFEQVSEADFEWLFAINFWGVVRMTRAFLPTLKASDDARIVNLSSIYGIVAPPGQTAYSASKFAVRGFSQSLAHELAGTSVGVTVVHPGGVATAIARNARSAQSNTPEQIAAGQARAARMLRLPPEIAGETIVGAIERRQARVLVGTDARIVAALERVTPVGYWKLLSRLGSR
ncbi:SDR family NAD(P)-dependent oxidoreductase [Chelatococcus reniformis]|uniref:Acetoin dehydrogenase n=1 Tax=Chelatococcus reniformis TaxID=1494448 RepID=A0A916U1Z9_9HYPH|nr:SDR family oxidoreductase [Chelatococcus reniformis]GGC53649.1 acetoin dehydrogenase [Chelatococcus reniformis]